MIRTGIIIVVLILVAFLSWRFKQSESVDASVAGEPVHQPDFFLANFRIRQFGETGLLRYRLDGQRLERFPSDERTLIDQPSMVLHDDGGPTWRITADNGEASTEALDEIRLQGDVEISRDAAATQRPPLRVTTASLLFKPKTEFVQSKNTITLVQPGARLVADSLEGNLQEGQFELRNVKGRYEP
jgi:lipopolysaccharide export system protein LptC